MDVIGLHRRACDEFGARVKAIGQEQWELPTPCAEWNVKAVVDHVVRFNRATPGLLEGATVADLAGLMAEDVLGDDPVASWEASSHEAVEAFDRPGALEAVVHHPAGDVSGAQFALFRFSDNLTHAWDVARAIGGDERLDPDLVDACYEALFPLKDFMPATGLFKPALELGEGADRQAEFLALQGRDPR